MKLRSLLALFVLWFLVSMRCDSPAFAATTPTVFDQKVCTGSAASSGGTLTCDYTTTTDRAHRVVALVGMSALSASHLNASSFLTCEGVFENKNGTLSLVPVLSGSNNPSNSGTTTFIAAHAQAADSAFGVGTPPLCAWSVSGTTVARVTATNNGGTTADVTILIQIFTWGSQ